MKKILVTGGTVFVSRYVATYFVKKGYDVVVLNRGSYKQVEGVTLVQSDRHHLKDRLKKETFDTIVDITAYNESDVKHLLEGLNSFNHYIFLSSSAVYPETLKQPFVEEQPIGINRIWGNYGLDKIKAEQYVRKKVPDAYILRPAYLYGPMQNLYREPFVFDCAEKQREFYIPKDGTMPLQFFHVEDLCKIIEIIIEKKPSHHIYNLGNEEVVTINTFVELCYQVVGTKLNKVYVKDHTNQRDYFCFHDYGYQLDVKKQKQQLSNLKGLFEGLKESYEWYKEHPRDVGKKEYIFFIEKNLKK